METNNNSFAWKCLDVRLGPIRGPIWQMALRDEFPLVQRYLTPVSELATEVSCSRNRQTGCNYRVVEHLDGSLVGICDEGYCPRRTFDRAELIRYDINHTRLLADLGRALSLDLKIEALQGPGVSFLLAALRPSSFCDLRSSISVIFARHSSPASFQTFVQEQILQDQAPFILLTPTLRHQTSAITDLLQRHGCRVVPLVDGIHIHARGMSATEEFLASWHQLLASFAAPDSQAHMAERESEPVLPTYGLFYEGDSWRFHFRGDSFTIRNSVGLRNLAHLLRHWPSAFNPVEVKALKDPRTLSEPLAPGESMEAEGSIETASAHAILKLKARLRQLNQEAAESEGHEVAMREIEDERDTLETELSRITTPGDRVRREGGTMDRARKSVSNSIRRLLEAISKKNPACARHLSQRLSLGFSMTYTPDAGEEWTMKARERIS